jgi:RNA polymerase sigma-54 factor
MKQSLQLRIGQSLTMTPQLQQAIRLLQLSTLELQTEIQQTLESNPLLEMDDGTSVEVTEPESAANGEEHESTITAEGKPDSIPDELPVDSNWEDLFDTGATTFSAPDTGGGRDPLEFVTVSGSSLRDHLAWQIDLTNLSDKDLEIAHAIIDSIDEDGYLTVAPEELLLCLDRDLDTELDEIEAVMHCIQQLDPIGVCARDLRECLMLQLDQFDPSTPWLHEARALLRDYFTLLSNRDFSRLCSKLNLTTDDLQHVVHLIQSLNPRPGSTYNTSEPEYIIPDVFVFKKDDQWQVELNPDSVPRLRINSLYANMIKRGSNSKDNNYLRDNLQEARWFLKSLQSRHETLLKVATSIVERQHAFFESGEEAMKPMVLRSIAEAIEMHESTVSRVTTRKYMHTPRGIYEFKYFFSSHVATEAGGECSATAIRAIIKKLVAAENPAKPLSDSKMADVLADQGINVARRTIAKYRESLSISPSNERKRLS